MACDLPVDPLQPQLNVFCVLRTDDVHSLVLVGRTVSFDSGHYGQGDLNGVADASVLVTDGDDSTRFRPVPETTGYYVADSLAAVAGRTYHLTVGCPGFHEVRGQTTAPGGFAVESVSIDTTVNPDTSDSVCVLTAAWSPSDGAARYQVIAAFLYSRSGTDTVLGYHGSETESLNGRLRAPLRRSSHGDTLPLSLIRLTAYAIDPNYMDYLNMLRQYGQSHTIEHLDGGLGVFGSICVAETTVYPTQPALPTTPVRLVRPTR
jgi:hypothetical protein